jgi:hypothetical protein
VSGQIQRSITCDIGGPDDPFGCAEYHGAPWHKSLAEVRKAAASEQGWTRRGSKDFCPDHSDSQAATQ